MFRQEFSRTGISTPSTAFLKPAEAIQSTNVENDDVCHKSRTFLVNKCALILHVFFFQNVKLAKVRKSLSKDAGGRAITELSVLGAIKQWSLKTPRS
jgi:hypothetical protein